MHRLLPSGVAVLVATLAAADLHAQRTLTVSRLGAVLSTETVMRIGDTLNAETRIPNSPVTLRARLELHNGRIVRFDAEAQAPAGAQQVRIEIDSTTAALTTSKAGIDSKRVLVVDPRAPTLIFQNFVFSLVEPILGALDTAAVLPARVRVLSPEGGTSEEWAIARDSTGALAMTTSSGLRLVYRFSHGRLVEMSVPSQNIVAHVTETTAAARP